MHFEEMFKMNPIIAVISQKGAENTDTFERTIRDADLFMSKGVDALIIEADKAHAAEAEKTLNWLLSERPNWRYGVHILGDLAQSCALAEKYKAMLVQADCVCGNNLPEFEDAYKACNQRGALLLGGIDSMEKADLKPAMQRCSAFVVDGTGLGSAPSDLQKIKDIIRGFPLIISGGISPETLKERLVIGDGAILNSEFRESGKEDGEISLKILDDFMDQMKNLHGALFLLRKMSSGFGTVD